MLRERVPTLSDDRYFHPDIEEANRPVRSRALVEAIGLALPGVA